MSPKNFTQQKLRQTNIVTVIETICKYVTLCRLYAPLLGALKMLDMKTQDVKITDQVRAGREIA